MAFLDGSILAKIGSFKSLWDSSPIKNSVSATDLLFRAGDDLIVFVEQQFNVPGTDKKTMVINGIDMLYDHTIADIMPFYLKPFNGFIKTFIVNNIASLAIDFFVSKYNDGSWGNLPTPAPTPTPPAA